MLHVGIIHDIRRAESSRLREIWQINWNGSVAIYLISLTIIGFDDSSGIILLVIMLFELHSTIIKC